MTPYLFGALAGVLAGLGAARLRHPAEVASRSGTVGFLAAAAGVAMLSPNVGGPVGQWALDTAGLASVATLLAHLLLITAAVAGSVHLLDRMEGARFGQVAIGSGVVAAAVMIWQWFVIWAHPATATSTDTRWYLVAFAAGLGVPLLVVLTAAVRTRTRTEQPWPTVLIAGSIAGIAWCALRVLAVLAPDAAAAVPGVISPLLAISTGVGLWFGNVLERISHNAPIVEDAPELDEQLDEDPVPLAIPEPEPEPEPEPDPVDPAEARERAVAMAAALAGQLVEVGRDSAVAVGVAGDQIVFCTPDGLGYLAEGGKGSEQLSPLITRVPTDFASQWIGCAHPQMPLLAAAEQGHVPTFDAVATVGPGGDLAEDDLIEIEPAPLSAPRSRTDAIAVSETHAVLAQLRDTWDADPAADAAELAAKVATERWTTWPNPDYPRAWAAELLARAAADLEAGDVDSARYVLRSAQRIPRPVPAPVTPVNSAGTSAVAPNSDPGQVLEALGLAPTPAAEPAPAPPPARATSILAALSKQIPSDAEIAVAVAADGTAVFATSDGLGHLPEGAHAAAQLTPLITLVGDAFISRWIGCDLPHEALLDAAAKGLFPAPVELVTTCADSTDGRVVSVSEQDLDAADPFDLPWPREQVDSIEESDVVSAYSEVTATFGYPQRSPRDTEQAAAQLRWTDTPNPEYAAAWARHLIASVDDAVTRGDKMAPRYLLRNALRIPSSSTASSSRG